MEKAQASEGNRPFVVFKTKQELVTARVQKQLEFTADVERTLNENFSSGEVLGATMTVNSPPLVVGVKPVSKPEDFFELAF